MQHQHQQPSRANTSSPFSTQSSASSPGAMPPPDAQWVAGGGWSLSGSAQSSRAPSPAHVYNRDQLADIGSFIVAKLGGQFPHLPSPSTTPAPPSEPSSSRSATPSPAARATPEKKKIPRPPNAFMLFRSDMIKTGQIPKDVEQRQQNISRVAGQCWNLLPPEQKAYWHQKAAEKYEEHMKMYPNYKFSPERKPSRRKASPDDIPQNTEDHIRFIRERYIGLTGPAVPPPRPRKSKSRRGVDAHAEFAPPSHHSLPPSLHPSPVHTPDIPRTASAPPSMAIPPGVHLGAMGPHGMSDYHPSVPGFLHNVNPGMFAHWMTQATQQPLQGDDSAPEASTFNDPTQAEFAFNYEGEGSAETGLGLAQGSYSAAATGSTSQQEAPSPDRWDYLHAPILADNGASPHDALNLTLDAGAVYGTDASAALDSSELAAWYH